MSEKTIKLDKNQKEKVNALIIALNGALPLSDEWKIYQKVTKIYSDISELYKLYTEHVNEEYINKYDNVAYHHYYDELNTTLDELIKNPSIKNLDPVKKYLEQKSGQISGGSRKKSRSTNVTKKKANKRSRSKNTIKKRRTSRKSVKKSKSKKTNKK